MSTNKYDGLLDTVITRCRPQTDKNIPFLIAIQTQSMELATVKKGLIKAKDAYTKQGKLPKNLQLIFFNLKHYTTDKNFVGFALGFRTVNKKSLTVKDI
jgi:hypothetical protein